MSTSSLTPLAPVIAEAAPTHGRAAIGAGLVAVA